MALDLALGLRGSRHLDARPAYETLVGNIVQRMNTRAAKLLVTERAILKTLPVRHTAEFEEVPTQISKYTIVTPKDLLYSVPSQLIGHRPMVRQYAQHAQCRHGGQCVANLPRARRLKGQRVGRSEDYRYVWAP